MAQSFLLFEGQHFRCLALRNVDAVVHTFHQLVFAEYKTVARIVGGEDAVGEEDRFLGTSLFAQAAENTTQHIDLVGRRVFFFAIKMFFSLLPFAGSHRDGFGRAGHRAKTTGCAALGSFVVALQHVLSAPHGAHFALNFRILHRSLLFEEVFDRYHDAAEDGRQIHALCQRHLFLNDKF